MHIIGSICWVLAALKWGDWKNWEKYHATLLFVIISELLYEILTYNHAIWVFSDFFLPTHTLNSLIVTFVGMTFSMLIYLYRYPEKASIWKQIRYILYWVLLYSAIELFFLKIDLFHHYKGWNIAWSVAFNCVLFTIVWIHYKRPLLAYSISIVVILFLVLYFKIPIEK